MARTPTYLQHHLCFRVPLLPTTVESSLCLCCASSAALTAAVLLLRLPSHAVLAELPGALAIASSTTQLQAGHITATALSGFWLSLCNRQQPRGRPQSSLQSIGLAQAAAYLAGDRRTLVTRGVLVACCHGVGVTAVVAAVVQAAAQL